MPKAPLGSSARTRRTELSSSAISVGAVSFNIIDLGSRLRFARSGLLFASILECSDHVERTLGPSVAFARKYRAATLDGLLDGDGLSRDSCELLSHQKRLREKPFEAAGARHDAPVFRAQLLYAQQRDDFLEFLVTRDCAAHFLGDRIMFFADDARIEQGRIRLQRIDGGIESLRRHVARQDDR